MISPEYSMADSWLVIFGTAQISDGEIIHVGPPQSPDSPTTPATPVVAPYSIVRSSREFEQGTILWEARLDEPMAACQVSLPVPSSGEAEVASQPTDTYSGVIPTSEFFAGLNILGAPYGFATRRGV
jgi:hypothetical protein